MDLKEERIGETCVITATGRLDGASSAAFTDRVAGLIDESAPKVLIDLAGVDFVTSAGLRAVLLILKRVKAAGGAFALCNVRAPVQEVFDISGFTSMLNIYGDRAEGVAALAG